MNEYRWSALADRIINRLHKHIFVAYVVLCFPGIAYKCFLVQRLYSASIVLRHINKINVTNPDEFLEYMKLKPP